MKKNYRTHGLLIIHNAKNNCIYYAKFKTNNMCQKKKDMEKLVAWIDKTKKIKQAGKRSLVGTLYLCKAIPIQFVSFSILKPLISLFET